MAASTSTAAQPRVLVILLLALAELQLRALALPAHAVFAATRLHSAALEINAVSEAAVASGRRKLDLLAAMQDQPPGSFFDLMRPLVEAVTVTYRSSSGPEFRAGMANATIPPEAVGGAVWERAYDHEVDETQGGVHARVFVDHKARKAIVAFRGICVGDGFKQCRVDECYLQSFAAFGSISSTVYRTSEVCKSDQDKFNYTAQADVVVRKVQSDFPDYYVLLTGHSLGGALAMVSAARQPGVLQAVTFAPTAFHELLLHDLKFSEEEITQLPAEDLIATGDPYDCSINAVYVHKAREGSTTCLYEGTREPWPCNPRMEKDIDFDTADLPEVILCKGLTHSWGRYPGIVLAKKSDGMAPVNLPTCSTNSSIFQPSLLQQASASLPALWAHRTHAEHVG